MDRGDLTGAAHERRQRAGDEGVAATDKQGLDVRICDRQVVDRELTPPRGALDEAARQQRDAEPGLYAAEDAVDRAEFELAQAGHSAPAQNIFEPLAVRAPSPQDYDLDLIFRRERIEGSDGRRRRQHELLAKDDFALQVGIVHRAADESALERTLAHALDQLAGGAGPERQVDMRI